MKKAVVVQDLFEVRLEDIGRSKIDEIQYEKNRSADRMADYIKDNLIEFEEVEVRGEPVRRFRCDLMIIPDAKWRAFVTSMLSIVSYWQMNDNAKVEEIKKLLKEL